MTDRLTAAEHSHLWDAFRRGSQESFAQLYELFVSDLYRYGYNLIRNKQVVEDCLHELFLHIYENRQRLGSTDNIRFYLYRALRRRLLDTVTKLTKFDSDDYLFDGVEFLVQSYEHELVEAQLLDQQKRLVLLELDKLPKRQKEILYLVYMKGLTYQQAAEVMNITMKSVYNTIHVALTALRTHLPDSFQQGGALLSILGTLFTYFIKI
jgi:RNA polymerase sigma-70 factor (ECF subfamily)